MLPPYLVLQRRGEDPWLRHALSVAPRALLPATLLSLGLLGGFVAAAALAAGGRAQAPDWAGLLRAAPYQLVFVALKEEYFFRGVLQPALERPGGPTRRVWGAPLGRGAVAAAALFALAHLYPAPHPARLLTFFPALWFAWLRARTGSLWPAIAAHAAANLVGQACWQAFGVGWGAAG